MADTTETIFDPLAALSDEQRALIPLLKESAVALAQDDREKTWLTDMCLIRYLRAREWKLEKAEEMLKASLEWRREWHVDDIKREDVIRTLNLNSLYRNGVDKELRPILFVKPSYNDNPVDYRLRSLVYTLEEAIQSMDVTRGVEKMCLIADFDTESKLQKKSPDGLAIAKGFLNILQNHYPERLGIFFALNLPWYVRMFYTLISPFIDPKTKAKIHFLNGNKDYIKAELLKHINEDQLESKYGGTRKIEPDPDVRDPPAATPSSA